jgi:hypothetical protein
MVPPSWLRVKWKTDVLRPSKLHRVPHLRDGLIVAKVGHFRGSENPDILRSAQIRPPRNGGSTHPYLIPLNSRNRERATCFTASTAAGRIL